MGKEKRRAVLDTGATCFPEHGPIAENGNEILLSLKHVDINFGKGDNMVRAVKMCLSISTRVRRFHLLVNPDRERRPLAVP